MRPDKGKVQPLRIHVSELRRRLIWVILSLLAGGLVGYIVRQPITEFLQKPLHQALFYTTPTGGFEFLLRICLLFGILIALPLAIFHLISFIMPAFSRKLSHSQTFGIVGGSLALGLCGLAFGYYTSLPAVLHFLSSSGIEQVKPLISGTEYLRFVTAYLTIFAIIFQLPLLILFINHVTPLKPSGLMKIQRWVVVGSFGFAFLVPVIADPVSQLLLALPVVIMFQFSIGLVWLVNRRRQKLSTTDPVEPDPPADSKSPVRQIPGPLDLRAVQLTPLETYSASPHLIDLRS